jgi:hypothetical protein
VESSTPSKMEFIFAPVAVGTVAALRKQQRHLSPRCIRVFQLSICAA